MTENDRIDGEFDDILGPDVPEKYKKTSINKKLIEAYERVVAKEKEKTIDRTEYGICTEKEELIKIWEEKEKMIEKDKFLRKLEKLSEFH